MKYLHMDFPSNFFFQQAFTICMAHTTCVYRTCTHGCVCVCFGANTRSTKQPPMVRILFLLPLNQFSGTCCVYSITDAHTHSYSLSFPCHPYECLRVCASCVHKQTHVQVFVCQNIFTEILGERAHTRVVAAVVVILRIPKQMSVQEGTILTHDEWKCGCCFAIVVWVAFLTCVWFERHPKYRIVNDVVNGVKEFQESNSIIRWVVVVTPLPCIPL